MQVIDKTVEGSKKKFEQSMLRFSFHTAFVELEEGGLLLKKSDIDIYNKPKRLIPPPPHARHSLLGDCASPTQKTKQQTTKQQNTKHKTQSQSSDSKIPSHERSLEWP